LVEIGLGSPWEGGEGVASKFTGNRWGDREHNNQPLTGALKADSAELVLRGGSAMRGDETTRRGKEESGVMRGEVTTSRHIERQWRWQGDATTSWGNQEGCASRGNVDNELAPLEVVA
jgi:hypothetical protein